MENLPTCFFINTIRDLNRIYVTQQDQLQSFVQSKLRFQFNKYSVFHSIVYINVPVWGLVETAEINSVLEVYFIAQLLKEEFDSVADHYFSTSCY